MSGMGPAKVDVPFWGAYISDVPLCLEDVQHHEREKKLYSLANMAHGPSFPPNTLNQVQHMKLWEELVCLVFLFFVPGGFLSLPLIVLVFMYFHPVLGFSLLLGLALLSVLPVSMWESVYKNHLPTLLFKYFSFKMVCKQTYPPPANYIYVAFPHGIFPYGTLLLMLATRRVSGFPLRGLAASVVLRIPVIRQALGWMGVIDASKKSALRALHQGFSIGLLPGGIAELFEQPTEDTETIWLDSRLGFVRLSIETGVPLIPTYIFGNSYALKGWYDSSGWLQSISRRIQASIFLFWGRYLLPIPFRVPITAVIGHPLYVKQNPNPTKEEVNELHQRFKNELIHLFDTHKASYGWAHKRLIIK